MVEFSNIKRQEEKQAEPSSKTPSLQEPEAVYNEIVGFVRETYQRFSEKKALDIEDVYKFMEKSVERICSADDKIIFLTSNTYLKEYLCYHSANVAVLSIRVGLDLGYPKEHLVNLGTLCLLHAINLPEEEGFSAQELGKQEFIQKFIQTKQSPKEFVKEALSIIAIIDVYESLTHTRAYRERFTPYEVLKVIISAAREVFDFKIVKKIVEIFSIYPLGSLVRLNSEEIAQVTKINKDFPLRPQLNILIDSQGNKLKEKKTVDLAIHLNLYIKESVSQDIPD